MPKPKRARVLMLLGWYFTDSVGGTENYVRMLARDIREFGWDSVVMAPSNDETEKSYEYEGVPVYRYPVSTNPSLHELRGLDIPEYFEFFINKVQELDPDVVHMHSNTRGCGIHHAQFIKNKDIPLILSVHVPDFLCARETLMKWGEFVCSGEMDVRQCSACVSQMKGFPKAISYSLNYVPKFIMDRAINLNSKIGTTLSMNKIISLRINNIRKLLSLSDQVVSVSKWLEKMLLINGVDPDKVILSPHGISKELTRKQQTASDMKNHILQISYIGRFKPLKGLHILIESIVKLPPSVSFELNVYGRSDTAEENKYLKRLKKMAEGEKRIKFCGEVTEQNRLEVMGTTDILAIPSICLETGPYVLLEAFATGTPVIGSDLGGISEHVIHNVNGLLVEPGSVESWGNSIKYLCENPQVIQKLASSVPGVRNSMDVAEEMSNVYKNSAEIALTA